MSNPALNRLLRGGGLTEFHVVAAGRRNQPSAPTFNGERFEFSAKTEYKKEHEFQKKENREEKHKKEDDHSDDDSSDGPAKKKKKGIYAKGEDADGDGKTGEGKEKITDFSDKNGNGKPDAFEKKKDKK